MLSRLTLRNIGPFDELEIGFEAEWNLLLGDNGVGKSIILRAIATALSGDKAPNEVVGRLLRAGTVHGRIMIELDGRAIVGTELLRDSTDAVMQRSLVPSPAASAALVLGFPALRAMTYEQELRGPRSLNPSLSDLLPILENRPDTRISQLKGWLIQQIISTKSLGEQGTRAQRTLQGFFALLSAVNTTDHLEFDSVDQNSWTILLRTDSGKVPLESVSQGAASVLCWVGVLYQRLHEVSSANQAPNEQPALVLLDEIDAHLHPAWQQTLIPTIQRLFPRLQVVATTHSPFMVASLPSRSGILVAKRSEGRIVVERPEVDLQDLRVDQILTSPVFGLESTRGLRYQTTLARYTTLVEQQGIRTVAEQEELQRLAAELRLAAPGSQETQREREAYALSEATFRERLQDVSQEERERLLREIQAATRLQKPDG